MPTYEYVCQKCGHQFEQFQSMLDQPLATCPRALCGRKRWGKGKVKRAIGAGAGLIFKGSGFYITDYRSEKYKQAASKDVGSSPPAATGAGKSESAGGGGSAEANPAKTGAKASTASAPKAE